jgi:HD superfamily phosphohydrolase YqeK
VLHPLVARAAEGELPPWTLAGRARRAHIRRVMGLLEVWARELGLGDEERTRWLAAGALHDVLRDAGPEELRRWAPREFRSLPEPFLHGPAAGARLREEGLEDEGLLRAVTFHTLGHPGLDAAGRALYAADFLEPGRPHDPAGRRELARRFPADPRGVVAEVVRTRIGLVLAAGRPVRFETVDFWNSLVGGDRGAP